MLLDFVPVLLEKTKDAFRCKPFHHSLDSSSETSSITDLIGWIPGGGSIFINSSTNHAVTSNVLNSLSRSLLIKKIYFFKATAEVAEEENK